MSSATYIRPTDFRTEALRFLGLLRALVVRELKSRYRRSVLGPAWAILQPLFYMLIFTFIRSVLNISSEGMPYVIFTYSALVPWTFFANAVTRCGLSVGSKAGLIKKIAIQREVFPVASVLTTLVDMLIASVILVGMMIWFRVPVTGALLWLPAAGGAGVGDSPGMRPGRGGGGDVQARRRVRDAVPNAVLDAGHADHVSARPRAGTPPPVILPEPDGRGH